MRLTTTLAAAAALLAASSCIKSKSHDPQLVASLTGDARVTLDLVAPGGSAAPNGTIAATVYDALGAGIGGLTLTLSGAMSGALSPSGPPGDYAFTPATPLAPGTYQVTFSGAIGGDILFVLGAADLPAVATAIASPADAASVPASADLAVSTTRDALCTHTALIYGNASSGGSVFFKTVLQASPQFTIPAADVEAGYALELVVSGIRVVAGSVTITASGHLLPAEHALVVRAPGGAGSAIAVNPS